MVQEIFVAFDEVDSMNIVLVLDFFIVLERWRICFFVWILRYLLNRSLIRTVLNCCPICGIIILTAAFLYYAKFFKWVDNIVRFVDWWRDFRLFKFRFFNLSVDTINIEGEIQLLFVNHKVLPLLSSPDQVLIHRGSGNWQGSCKHALSQSCSIFQQVVTVAVAPI